MLHPADVVRIVRNHFVRETAAARLARQEAVVDIQTAVDPEPGFCISR